MTAHPTDTATRRPGLAAQLLALLVLLAIPVGVGFLGSALTSEQVDGWYAQADVAPWNPPNWVFGPVWTVLYLMMGLAAWLVWRERAAPGRSRALSLFAVQLVLNGLWTPIFFGAYPLWGSAALWLAFAVIVAMIAAVGLTVQAFRRVHGLASVLLLPYLVWILYASTLNLYIAVMN
ncbi:TspO/MBR family protein [Nesterenkonia xinjiangensis]|uniref:Tryptophan-rich sensory protein n=1 Tax=Nesterenkonia xinjiangensis TaxID=225327 RepID=A0A7Z0GKR8_9MICC|nr:TspO/MBR family protein [Nesterenkonia xinjiangensis]NYJ77790.1 tryptophan-rich sensory protein [Nesterenkonia xinjiangensis]